MWKNKVRTAILCGVAFLAITALFGLRTDHAHADPFECTTGFYQVISGQLKILDPDTGTYVNIGPADAAMPNAIGYNSEDDHIYGMGSFSGDVHLVRYEHDGTFTDLGLPTGLTDQSYVAGDFDDAGNLWVREFGSDDEIWRIDVSAGTATMLALSANIFVSEMVYIDGYLYGLNGPALTRININTGVVTTQNVVGLVGDVPAFSAFGAGWKTVDNRLYFSRNTNGIIYEVLDYEVGGTSSAVPVLQGEIPTSNDGASCPNATTPIADVNAEDKSETVVQNSVLEVSAANGVLSDATGYDLVIDSYTQPSHGSVVVESDGSYIYTPDYGYNGEDSFTFTISDGFGNVDTATVTITVTPLLTDASSSSDDQLAETGEPTRLVMIIGALLVIIGAAVAFRTFKK